MYYFLFQSKDLTVQAYIAVSGAMKEKVPFIGVIEGPAFYPKKGPPAET